jgi:Protein of unknown function (DUF3175)
MAVVFVPEEEASMASEKSRRRWSAKVTQTSDALDLEGDIFKSRSERRVAASLKHSAEHSHRRKTSPFQSAMSMLNFYINRAGRNLPASRKKVLETAKSELRRLFGRTATD